MPQFAGNFDHLRMIEVYCIDTATWTTYAVDQWGSRTPTAVSIQCRVNEDDRVGGGRRLVRNEAGEEVITSRSVEMRQKPSEGDSITFEGVEARVVAVSRHTVFGGEAWYTAWLA